MGRPRDVEYLTEPTKSQHIKYRWYCRVITTLWVLFTICYAILNVIVFIRPQWLGDTPKSNRVGYFGLYERCYRYQVGEEYQCTGDFLNMESILNDYFRAASVLVGLSALLFIISAITTLFFFFLKAEHVLRMCGLLQLLASLCISLGCIIFPAGWDHEEVTRMCGTSSGRYMVGLCAIRWSYILAIVLVIDGFILSILAFCLASRQAKLLPKYKEEKSSVGIENNGFQSDSFEKNSNGSGSFTPVDRSRPTMTTFGSGYYQNTGEKEDIRL